MENEIYDAVMKEELFEDLKIKFGGEKIIFMTVSKDDAQACSFVNCEKSGGKEEKTQNWYGGFLSDSFEETEWNCKDGDKRMFETKQRVFYFNKECSCWIPRAGSK